MILSRYELECRRAIDIVTSKPKRSQTFRYSDTLLCNNFPHAALNLSTTHKMEIQALSPETIQDVQSTSSDSIPPEQIDSTFGTTCIGRPPSYDFSNLQPLAH